MTNSLLPLFGLNLFVGPSGPTPGGRPPVLTSSFGLCTVCIPDLSPHDLLPGAACVQPEPICRPPPVLSSPVTVSHPWLYMQSPPRLYVVYAEQSPSCIGFTALLAKHSQPPVTKLACVCVCVC